MNSRFVPHVEAGPGPRASAPTAAIVTASYAPDFERCRLLCETLDRNVAGAAHHYILVEHRDVALFRQLENARRTVIDERALLPGWLRPFDDPSSLFRRRIWLSHKTRPMRGWHVQQLRRIAIAPHIGEDVLVYVDSDVAFLKPFECSAFWHDGKTRLFRRPNALLGDGFPNQRAWSGNAGRVLGIADPTPSPHDYISTLISWNRSALASMCAHIEKASGRGWIEAIAQDRKFSECMIYGRYVDDVLAGAGHFHGEEELCRIQWYGPSLSDDAFRDFVDTMGPEQVAIGMQSFIGTDLDRIRHLVG